MKCCSKILHLHVLWISNHIAKWFCMSEECHHCMPAWYHVNELAKAHQKTYENNWGNLLTNSKTNVNSFISKRSCSLRSQREKIKIRRCRRIFKSNSSYNFLLKGEYWFDLSILCKSPNNNSILKKRGR